MKFLSQFHRMIALLLIAILVFTSTACTSDLPIDRDRSDSTAETPLSTTEPSVDIPSSDTMDSSIPSESSDASQTEGDLIVSTEGKLRAEVREAWRSVFPENQKFPDITEYEIEWRTDVTHALLSGDGAALAKALYIPSEVYECYDGFAVSDWSVRRVSIDDHGMLREAPVLDLTVTESNVPTIPSGKHSFVLEEGIERVFLPLETYGQWDRSYTSAQSFVTAHIDYVVECGISHFIVWRLNTLADNSDPRTKEEIEEYARGCLDIDPQTLAFEKELDAVDGGYQIKSTLSVAHVLDIIGEEKRGDTTVVTVRFWADYSKTVEAKVVEYHLVPTDIDWQLIDTVTIRDSGFKDVCYSP